MNIPVWWEEVVHDDKMNFAAVRDFDPMETVKLREQGVWVVLDMIIIMAEDFPKHLVLRVVNRFDDVFIISGEIEKASTLSWRPKFGENVFTRQGHEVIGRINPEYTPKMFEYPGSIVFKLEIVLGRGCQLIAGSIKVSVIQPSNKAKLTYRRRTCVLRQSPLLRDPDPISRLSLKL